MDEQATGAATVAERPPPTPADATSGGTREQSPAPGTTPAQQTADTTAGESPPKAADAGAGTPDAEADETRHWEWLNKRDPRELVQKNRRLAGYVGSEADRLTRDREPQLRQRWEAETDFAKLRTELNELRDGPNADAEEYVRKERELEGKITDFNVRQQAAEAEQTRQWGSFDGLLHQVYGALPDGVRTKLAGRTWDLGHPALSRQAYLNDMLSELQEYASTAGAEKKFERELPRRLREAEEGLRKQVLNGANGGGPGLDNGAGSPPPNGTASQAEWDAAKNRGKVEFRAWRTANKARIDAGVASRAIYRD